MQVGITEAEEGSEHSSHGPGSLGLDASSQPAIVLAWAESVGKRECLNPAASPPTFGPRLAGLQLHHRAGAAQRAGGCHPAAGGAGVSDCGAHEAGGGGGAAAGGAGAVQVGAGRGSEEDQGWALGSVGGWGAESPKIIFHVQDRGWKAACTSQLEPLWQLPAVVLQEGDWAVQGCRQHGCLHAQHAGVALSGAGKALAGTPGGHWGSACGE